MFLPYRTIGYVVDHNPPLLTRLGNSNFLYTSIGRSWQVYNCANLRLKNTSPEKDGQIAAIASLNNQIMATAIGNQIVIWRRTQEVCRITPPEGNRVVKLMSIGNLLLSLSHDSHLYTWDCSSLARDFAEAETSEAISSSINPQHAKGMTKTDNLFSSEVKPIEFLTHVYLPPPVIQFSEDITLRNTVSQKNESISTIDDSHTPMITSWCHPNTYNNKMLIGWSNGVMELWNVRSGKMIYRFACIDALDNAKLKVQSSMHSNEQQLVNAVKNKSICCIENAPALDVVAIGRANGDIILFNIKLDRIIHCYTQADGAVTALSFRSDDTHQHLISASSGGGITLWNLKQKEAIWSRGGVHGGGVTAAYFLLKEPILITAGRDNAIIQWHFEGTQMTLLRAKQGHYRPPSEIKWYSFNEIITGGSDGTLRYWSPTRDRAAQTCSWKNIPTNAHRATKNVEHGHLTSAQRVIRGLDLTPIYHPERPSAVTLNSSDTDKVTLWSIENHRAEKLIGNSASAATNVCFSYCGQFLYIGSRNGELKKYNIQSGALRAVLTPDRVVGTSHGDQGINKIIASKSKKARIAQKALNTGQLLEKGTVHGTNPHQHGIAGLYCAMGNDYLVSVGRDGVIYTWDCEQNAMVKKLVLPKTANISNVSFSAEHSLLGVVTSENDIYLIDCDRLCIIRQWLNTTEDGYSTQRGRLIHILLHPHLGLMFVTDSLGGIKTYDLSTGIAIHYTLFSRPVLSLDICSPSRDVRSAGDMLVTTHVGSIGVYIWIINPSQHINSALLSSTASILNSQHNNKNTALVTSQITLAQGNVSKSIDQKTLDKEQKLFEQKQRALLDTFYKENSLIDLDHDELNIDNIDGNDSEDGDDLDMKYNISDRLNTHEKKIYRKLCQSNHFTTVNVLRNITLFDQFITKPNIQVSGKDLLDLTNEATSKQLVSANAINSAPDVEESKKLNNILIIQKILFKQLHNEMNQKLTMLSGITSSRWKLLTQQQAIAQRNEAIKKQQLKANEDIPFFLNIQTGQTKTASKTTYNIDPLMNIREQQKSIFGAKNNEFDLFTGIGTENAMSLSTLCLNIATSQSIFDYINPPESLNIDAEDDEFDDILVSVNDKKNQRKPAANNKDNHNLGNDVSEPIAPKLSEKQKKILEAEKQRAKELKERIMNEKIFDMCMLLRLIYLHQLPLSPPQYFITNYLHTYPEKQYSHDIKDIILEEYHQHLKNLRVSLKINLSIDKKALTPIITYLLTTPPSLISAQIANFETEFDLFIFLHTLYLITLHSLHANGGMIDAVNALLQHTLQQHKLLVSSSPLCRTVSSLLVLALKKQWTMLESLFHSNLAVINHLTGIHQGF